MDANSAVTGAKDLLTAVTAELTIANVVSVISVGLGSAVGLFLMYWGGRKLVKMLIGAFSKGKISL